MTWSGCKWAYRSSVPRFSDFIYNEEGDAAWSRAVRAKSRRVHRALLEQTPRVQGLSTPMITRRLRAGDGRGDDFDRSRVQSRDAVLPAAWFRIQAHLLFARPRPWICLRHPWNDKPKAEVDPITGELWVPQNIDGSYNVQVTLERALVWSKNPPSVEIFKLVGSKDVEGWAHRLGISTPLITAPKCEKEFCSSLALGASCVHLDEITNAFSVFARNGKIAHPITIRRILDRQGNVLEDHSLAVDPWLPTRDKLDRIAATAGDASDPSSSPERHGSPRSSCARSLLSGIRSHSSHQGARCRQDRHVQPHF